VNGPEFVSYREFTEALRQLRAEIQQQYVGIDRFRPVERLFYALAGAVLAGFLGALVSFFIRRP
jgi:hypothetical protein